MHDDKASWLTQLIALGQKQSYLTFEQVNNSLPLSVIDPVEIGKITDRLEGLGIKLLPESPD